MSDYLLKTEPTVYSFADLQREKETVWDGVTNPAAVKHLRRRVQERDVKTKTGKANGRRAGAGPEIQSTQ